MEKGEPLYPETELSVTYEIKLKIRGSTRPYYSKEDWEDLQQSVDLHEDELCALLDRLRKVSNYNWEPMVEISQTCTSERTHDEFMSRRAKRRFDYFVTNFPAELRNLAFQLAYLEFELADVYRGGPDVGACLRPLVIKNILNGCKARVRKRLPKNNGRYPPKDAYFYTREKEEFIYQCIEALEALKGKGRKLNKRQMALELFQKKESTIEHPEKALSNQLKKYEISMWQLLDTFNGSSDLWIELHNEEVERFLELHK